MIYRVVKNRLKIGKNVYNLLCELSHTSKNLYNETLYTVKQHYLNTSEFLCYEKAYHLLKEGENYKLLPSQTAQQTMRIVDKNFKSFLVL